MKTKGREEYFYIVYLFSEPYFMVLDDESIIDVNILTKEIKIPKKTKRWYGMPTPKQILELKYNDTFFDYNLKSTNRDTFSVTIQTYNRMGQFLQQMELHGEYMSVKDGVMKLEFDQVTNNNAWSSISPKFESAADLYKRERVAYLRDLKIDTLLK